MNSNFDSIIGDENLDNSLEQKIITIEQVIDLIGQIIEQLKLSNSLKGFEFVRSNLFGTVFKDRQNKELQVIIDSNEKLQWIMLMDGELSLTIGRLDSDFSMVLNRMKSDQNIGILNIDGQKGYIGEQNSNYDTFLKAILKLVSKF